MTAEVGGGLGAEDTNRHLSTYLSACLATCLSAFPSVLYLFICQSIFLSVFSSITCLCVCVSELPTAFTHSPASPGNPNLLAASATPWSRSFLRQPLKPHPGPGITAAPDTALQRILQSRSNIMITKQAW